MDESILKFKNKITRGGGKMEMQAERQKRRVINPKSQACNKVGVGGWG